MKDRLPETLLLATHNAGKLEEFCALFKGRPVTLLSASELGLPEPAETEETFEGNALIKARSAASQANMVALADDSGLCIDALNGAPGVRSADWSFTPSGRDFGAAMERVRRELAASGSVAPWSARFVCVLALVFPEGSESIFRGEAEGTIVFPGRGSQGHGYDPIFMPSGDTATFGEMDRWHKNRTGHRGKAVEALLRRFT